MIKPNTILKIIIPSFFKGSIEVELNQGELNNDDGEIGRWGDGVKSLPIPLSPDLPILFFLRTHRRPRWRSYRENR